MNRPRGLCWSCYYRPGVRDLYPSTSKYARRGVEDFYGPAPLPARPTAATAGSDEKIRVLAERAKAKLSLWHPADELRIANKETAHGSAALRRAGGSWPP